MALYLKMFVLVTAIDVPDFMLVSKSAQFSKQQTFFCLDGLFFRYRPGDIYWRIIVHLSIVNRGKWLGRQVNIKEANKQAEICWKVLDPANLLFFAH